MRYSAFEARRSGGKISAVLVGSAVPGQLPAGHESEI